MKQAEYREAKERENDAEKALGEAAKLLNDLKEPIMYGGPSYFYTYTQLFKFLILLSWYFELLDEKVAYILAGVDIGVLDF